MKAYIDKIEKTKWFELAPFDDNLLYNGLHTIGLSENEIKQYNKEIVNIRIRQFTKSMPEYNGVAGATLGGISGFLIGGPAGIIDRKNWDLKTEIEAKYQKNLIDFLKEKLGVLVFEIEQETIIDSLIPIFKFNSPKIDGCEILYESSTSETLKNSFNVTIFGSGLGNTHKVKLTSTNSFRCTNGSYKLVYIPIKLKSSLICIVEKNGKLKNRFIQTELDIKQSNKYFDIGIKEIDKQEFLKDIKTEEETKNYYLLEDKTDSVHIFQEIYNKVEDFNYKIGINAFNINAFCDMSISRENEIVLKYKLPAGRNYQVKKIMNGLGLYCI